MIRIVLLFPLLFLLNCTQNKQIVEENQPVPLPPQSQNFDIGSLKKSNEFIVFTQNIDLGTTDAVKTQIDYTFFLENTSDEKIFFKVNFPSKNGYSIKKNFCLNELSPKQKCEISINFNNSTLKNGTYNDTIEVYSTNKESSVTSLISSKVVDKPSDSTNSNTTISLQMKETFLAGTSVPYRKVFVQNDGNESANLIYTLPIGYVLRSTNCPSTLLSKSSCYLEVLYLDYKKTLPKLGILYLKGNFLEKKINIISGTDNVYYLPVYSSYSQNNIEPCSGQGIQVRTISDCRVWVDNINYDSVDLSNCQSFETTNNLQRTVQSPAGIKTITIENGFRQMLCLQGETTGNYSYLCNSNSHEEFNQCVTNRQICSVPNGTGYKDWNDLSNSYGFCIANSCDNGFHAGNGCEANSYTSGYEGNPLQACSGSTTVFPISCQESWGSNLSTNITNCIGQSKNYLSPAGIKIITVANGRKEIFCESGQLSGNETFYCNSGYHNENGLCISNQQACSDSPNSLTGIKYWGGLNYGDCQATSCISNYHLDNGLCQLNSYTPNYSSNPLESCDGIISNVDPISCKENWGSQIVVDKSLCFSQKGSYSSPEGIRNYPIANGTINVFCAAGSTVQNIMSVSCENVASDSGYHQSGNSCVPNTISCQSLPLGADSGIQVWDGSNYGSCQISSCSSGYRLFSGQCYLEAYTPVFPINTKGFCDGSSIVNPIQCFENWGTNNEVSVLFCSGLTELQKSPAGTKMISLLNGTNYITCSEGSSTGSSSFVCNPSHHEESNDCLSDIKQCSLSELTTIHASAGTRQWNGTTYNNCQATTCSTGYHLDSGSCLPNLYYATFLTNSLQPCDGTNIATPSQCFENWGSNNLVSNSFCSGQTQNQQSPAGTKTLSITNGIKYEICAIGASTGTVSFSCDLGYHEESNSCMSDSKSCSTTELNLLHAATGTLTWNGSSYGACNPTSCSTGYHLEVGLCEVNTYTAIFDSNPIAPCLGLAILNPIECREYWSNNVVSLTYCNGTTVSRQSQAGSTTYSIPHGSRTDTCPQGSSTPTNSVITCSDLNYVPSGLNCVFNSSPIFSGSLTLGLTNYTGETSPSLTFSSATDPEGNSISYEYSYGTTSGGTELHGWTAFSPTGTTTLTIASVPMSIQPESSVIFMNVRAKDSLGAFSTPISTSFTYTLGWPYGLQSNINGSSGNCAFSGGNLTVSGGTCILLAGYNYDFLNVTIDSSGILKFVYDLTGTYSIDPTNNPGQGKTTTNIQKYTIFGIRNKLINNGSIYAEGNPFVHTNNMGTSGTRNFTLTMPSGSLVSSGLTFIAARQSGNGGTYWNGTQYSTTNANSVPFSTGGNYGGGGGGITLDSLFFSGSSNSLDSSINFSGTFNDGVTSGAFPDSPQGLACGSSNMNGTLGSQATSSNMAIGGHGGKSLINKYFCGAAGATGLARISSSGFSIFDGKKNRYGGGGGGAKGANGQILVIHSHSLIQSSGGVIFARGENGGGGAVGGNCDLFTWDSLFNLNSCVFSANGSGGNGAGGNGGRVLIYTPTTSSYLSVQVTGGTVGVGGIGGEAGNTGSVSYSFAR